MRGASAPADLTWREATGLGGGACRAATAQDPSADVGLGWDRVRVLRRKKKVWAASLPSWRHLGCLDAILALDLWLLGTWGDSCES
jgi:hypothetical protein